MQTARTFSPLASPLTLDVCAFCPETIFSLELYVKIQSTKKTEFRGEEKTSSEAHLWKEALTLQLPVFAWSEDP